MGIGGAGMNALAEWLLREGTEVSGCDSRESDTIGHLRALGATIDIGHDPAHVDAAGALVVTAAVPPDHPELQRARERGIAVAKRAEALGAVVHPHRVIAIAGTHGKTSTSALTVHVLAEAGLDPTGFVGGHVAAWQGNLRRGASDLVVVEADEYDRSFHQLRPEVAVVTNLEADHLDIYGDLAGVHEAFRVFAQGLVPGGALIVCADDVGACSVLGAHPAATTYGLSAGSELRAVEVEADSTGQRFRIIERGHDRGRAELPRHGVHALRNALAAAAVARRFGVEWPVIFEAWRSHRGVQRRFELHGTPGGVTVIDDYAHHPEEIRATIRAVRDGWPGHTLRAAFQPHLYSRTRDFADDFGAALAGADEVWLTALYPAREAPIPGVSEELVASAAERHGAAVRRHESLATLPEALVAACEPGDVLLCMGAGSIGEVAPKVAQQLRDRESVEQRPSAGSSEGSAAGSSTASATSTEVDA
jgi:UDP-N-acetylmuramate--alanine ligase